MGKVVLVTGAAPVSNAKRTTKLYDRTRDEITLDELESRRPRSSTPHMTPSGNRCFFAKT